MSQSARNTRISRHRLGCRLPFETRDAGDGYASAGPVKTYRLSPGELARYGPVTDPERAEWIRAKHRGLAGPRSRKEDVDDMKLEEAMELLPREKLEGLLVQGVKHREIIAEYGISVGMFYALLDRYGIPRAKQRDNPGGGNVPQTPVNGSKNVENCLGNTNIPTPPEEAENEAAESVTGTCRGGEGHICACPVDLSGVACPLPGAMDERLAGLWKLWTETSTRLDRAVAVLNELQERLDDLEDDYRHHRHQVGPGHWSGKGEV